MAVLGVEPAIDVGFGVLSIEPQDRLDLGAIGKGRVAQARVVEVGAAEDLKQVIDRGGLEDHLGVAGFDGLGESGQLLEVLGGLEIALFFGVDADNQGQHAAELVLDLVGEDAGLVSLGEGLEQASVDVSPGHAGRGRGADQRNANDHLTLGVSPHVEADVHHAALDEARRSGRQTRAHRRPHPGQHGGDEEQGRHVGQHDAHSRVQPEVLQDLGARHDQRAKADGGGQAGEEAGHPHVLDGADDDFFARPVDRRLLRGAAQQMDAIAQANDHHEGR